MCFVLCCCVVTHVNIEKSLEVLVWMGNEVLSIWSEDSSMSVVNVRVLQFLARGSV